MADVMAVSSASELRTPSGGTPSAGVANWGLATRIAFRFFLIYFSLYVLLTVPLVALFRFVDLDFSGIQETKPVSAAVFWVGRHIFHVSHQMVVTGSGSGDKTFDWVLNFCILVLACLAAATWSLLDRQRRNYDALHSRFRLFLRFSLAATMIVYGMAKVIPLQMPAPTLTRLLEPFGDFSLEGVLWSFVGSSKAYEIALGCAELAGGIFLFLPRTTTFGALICLADLLQVFLLNMTYDVPVKLFSFNLILFATFLLAPDARRLVNVFFMNRAAAPAPEAPLIRGTWARRLTLPIQVLFGLSLLAGNFYFDLRDAKKHGSGRPKSPLYGIWTVEDFSTDGQPHPPLLTDTARWRRVIFDFPEDATIERMDGTKRGYGAKIDVSSRTIELNGGDDNNKNWKAGFSFARPAAGQLVLDGSLDSHKIHARLALFDHSKFLLLTRGFHWVQEYPFDP